MRPSSVPLRSFARESPHENIRVAHPARDIEPRWSENRQNRAVHVYRSSGRQRTLRPGQGRLVGMTQLGTPISEQAFHHAAEDPDKRMIRSRSNGDRTAGVPGARLRSTDSGHITASMFTRAPARDACLPQPDDDLGAPRRQRPCRPYRRRRSTEELYRLTITAAAVQAHRGLPREPLRLSVERVPEGHGGGGRVGADVAAPRRPLVVKVARSPRRR
jgi:hypothetical protein